ncbi:MAG: HIT family protein [Candidatus Pacebacteria bacterium]|nr:HIT family protein [Candidatus Paceibacterota bacterium]
MENCLFCKIVRGEIKGDVIYEDEKAMALLDINPRAPGHAFVIPKEHYENLLEVPNEELGGIFLAVKKTAEKLKEKMQADALSIGINNGRVSGQEIDHLHIHIIPRFKGDGGGSFQSIIANIPDSEEKERIKKLLT